MQQMSACLCCHPLSHGRELRVACCYHGHFLGGLNETRSPKIPETRRGRCGAAGGVADRMRAILFNAVDRPKVGEFGRTVMTIPRRRFLQLATGAALLPA